MNRTEKLLRKCERARRTDRWIVHITAYVLIMLGLAALIYFATHLLAVKTPHSKKARTYMDDIKNPTGLRY